MIDKNWARWVFASASSAFEELRGGLAFFVEGSSKAGRRGESDYVEFRLNGPLFKEVSRDYWQCWFDVSLIVTSMLDSKDAHKLQRDVGVAAAMFRPSIVVRKFGTGPDDDPDEQLGCAELVDGTSGVAVNHFGQWDPTVKATQASVEGTYRLDISL